MPDDTAQLDARVRAATAFDTMAELLHYAREGHVPLVKSTPRGQLVAEAVLTAGYAVSVDGIIRQPTVAPMPLPPPAKVPPPPPQPKASPTPKVKPTNAAVPLMLLTLAETAKVLRVSVRHLQYLVSRREIAVTRFGRRTLFRVAEIEKYVQRRTK